MPPAAQPGDGLPHITEVEYLLVQYDGEQRDEPLIIPECITLGADWRSKEEVIKGMVDNLLLAGRCRYPRKLAADVWAREALFPLDWALGLPFRMLNLSILSSRRSAWPSWQNR